MKRLLSFLFTILLVLTWAPSMSVIAIMDGDFEYEILSDNTAEITYYNGSETELVIPDTVDGYIVTGIGGHTFMGNVSLQTIQFPESVAYIGNLAFYGCNSLRSATLSNSITSIGEYAFYECTSLQNMTLPEGISSIGGYAFYGCTSLQNINLPNSISHIGERAFYDCESVQSIRFPSNTTSIGKELFSDCESLQTIIFSEGIKSIGDGAFSRCKSLQNISIPNSVTNIGDGAFSDCESLTNLIIPDSVTTIEDNTFTRCTSLQSILLSDKITSIGAYAFSNCVSLEEITLPKNLTHIKKYAFSNCVSLERAIASDSLVTIEESAFSWCESIKSMTLPDKVTNIGEYAFQGCASLERIIILGELTKIKRYTFSDCVSLKSIALPNTINHIEGYAFIRCHIISDIYFKGNKAGWDNIIIDYGQGNFTKARIHYKTTGEHWNEKTIIKYPTCSESGLVSVSCACGYTAEIYTPANGHKKTFIKTVAPTCSTEGYTLYNCEICNNLIQEDLVPCVCTYKNDICMYCSLSVEQCLASTHPYDNNASKTWFVQQYGAKSISLTFSCNTELEAGFDVLSFYDANDNLVGSYSGTELAGQTITVEGSFIKIQLASDESTSYYGFAVTSISVEYNHDVNGDNIFDTNDARYVLCRIAGLEPALTDEEAQIADMNEDGKINSIDIRRMLWIIANE